MSFGGFASAFSDLGGEPEQPLAHLLPAQPLARSLDDIFAEEPVDLTTFITDAKFMSSPPLGPIQYEAVQAIERVYLPDLYPLMGEAWPYWAQHIPMANDITLQWGKGGGKDHICRAAALRVAYLLLCLKNPQRYYGIPEQDTISLLNIASSSNQAERAFFRPMTRVVKKGWFTDKASPTLNSIVYAKNVEAISGHSDAEGQEGLNLILGVADEIDAFVTKEETERYRGNQARESPRSAEAVLNMLKTSASTRFMRSYKRVAISYPRYLGSTIQRMTNEGRQAIEERGDEAKVYVSGPWCTWEVNPRFDGEEFIEHPNADRLIPAVYEEDYTKDPVLAKAKYECKPSRAVDAYFKNMDAIRSSVTRDHQPIEIDYDLVPFHSEETGQTTITWAPTFTFEADFLPQAGALYALHADLAINNDCAGVTLAHVSKFLEREEIGIDEEGGEVKLTHRLPLVKVDFVTNFAATKSTTPAREIQIWWVRKLVFELNRRGFKIARVTYDGFQSVDSIQTLALHGIETDRKSTDREDTFWKTLRDVAYEGRLDAPFSQRCLGELEALGRFGPKIDHPAGGSKDEADSFAIAISMAIELGGEETGETAYPSEAEFKTGGSDGGELVGYDNIDPFQFETPYTIEDSLFTRQFF